MSRPKRKSSQRNPYSDNENEEDSDTRENEPRSNKPKAPKASKAQKGSATPAAGAGPSAAPAAAAQANPVDKSEASKILKKIQEYEEKAHQKRVDANLQITPGELDSLVGKVVRHVLFKWHEEPDKPISRNHLAELVKADYKEHKQARKLPTVVIVQAQAKMITTFGYEMRELEHRQEEKAKPKADDSQGSGQYVLRSLLPAQLRELCMLQPAREQAKHALTMVVLALIHMSGGKLEAEQLWQMLGKLGVRHDMKEHPRFGNEEPKALIERLEKIKFLSKSRRQDGDTLVDVYEWGEHAHDHISKEEINEFINSEFNQVAAADAE